MAMCDIIYQQELMKSLCNPTQFHCAMYVSSNSYHDTICSVCCLGATIGSNFYTGSGSGPVNLDKTTCTGAEGDLLGCTSTAASALCTDHSLDIGLSCQGQYPSCLWVFSWKRNM